MEFIKKHKSCIIVISIVCILLILITLVVKFMFMGSDNIYGNRLKDAPVIEEKIIDSITSKILENKFVVNVTYNKNVVTMKFFIDVNKDTKIETAKKLSQIIIDSLDEKIVKFYDIEIYITQKEGKDENYPMIGYHSKSSDEFTWVINQGENNEE